MMASTISLRFCGLTSIFDLNILLKFSWDEQLINYLISNDTGNFRCYGHGVGYRDADKQSVLDDIWLRDNILTYIMVD